MSAHDKVEAMTAPERSTASASMHDVAEAVDRLAEAVYRLAEWMPAICAHGDGALWPSGGKRCGVCLGELAEALEAHEAKARRKAETEAKRTRGLIDSIPARQATLAGQGGDSGS